MKRKLLASLGLGLLACMIFTLTAFGEDSQQHETGPFDPYTMRECYKVVEKVDAGVFNGIQTFLLMLEAELDFLEVQHAAVFVAITDSGIAIIGYTVISNGQLEYYTANSHGDYILTELPEDTQHKIISLFRKIFGLEAI
jgi:hypothetical protein